jgi:hypothetical protein
MDKQQHIHELIDQYLMGELIGQELDKFKIRLKDDPAFLLQVQLQKAIINSVEIERKAQLKALLIKGKSKKKRFIIPLGNRSLAVAASILSLLAFGLIIKTMLPNGFNDMAENKTQEPEPELVEDSSPIKQEIKDKNAEGVIDNASDSTIIETPPVIALVETFDDEAITESDVLLDSDVDMAELKKDEDEIDAKDLKAKRDSMLGSSSVTLWVVDYKAITPVADKQVVTTTENKSGGILNRRKNKSKEVDDTEETVKNASEPTIVKNIGATVRVEFWESIVKFKGYKFNGSTLLLFDTPVNTPVALQVYGGKTYLNKNGVHYLLVSNNSFNQMSKVVDQEMLKILNTK